MLTLDQSGLWVTLGSVCLYTTINDADQLRGKDSSHGSVVYKVYDSKQRLGYKTGLSEHIPHGRKIK